MKKTIVAVVLSMLGCTTVNPSVRDEEMSKTKCESMCIVLGYEVREVRDGNCICNMSKCRFERCEPLPPPPTK